MSDLDHRPYWVWSSLGSRRHYVKNLEWLHRHAGDVYAITYFTQTRVMLAHLHGRYYRAEWESARVFDGWYRARFADVPLFLT